jgi:hypothetical protein
MCPSWKTLPPQGLPGCGREAQFSQAAEQLFLTQLAIRLQIKALEDDLGVRLFHRGAGQVSLTRQGAICRCRFYSLWSGCPWCGPFPRPWTKSSRKTRDSSAPNIEKFDTSVPANHAILVPWNEGDNDTKVRSEKLQAALLTLFRSKYLGASTSPFFEPRITSVDELRTTLPALLETIRGAIDTYRAARRQYIQPTGPAPEVRTRRETSE